MASLKSFSSNPIKNWQPKNFALELSSIWDFPSHGNWATHDSQWRGNWSPYIPRNIILRYSKENDLILDQFIGGGTTLVEAKLLNRNIIGIDVNNHALEYCRKKIDFKYPNSNSNIYLQKGDARKLANIPNNSIDLICTHPPYANIIHYSEKQNIPSDLSSLNSDDFLKQMQPVANESYRVLKPNKFCAILMGDIRQQGHVIPLGFNTMQLFISAGFHLKEIIIKKQHNCSSTNFWKAKSLKYNFLLLAHEYLFIFKK